MKLEYLKINLKINFQVEPVPSSENTRYVWQGETRWRVGRTNVILNAQSSNQSKG